MLNYQRVRDDPPTKHYKTYGIVLFQTTKCRRQIKGVKPMNLNTIANLHIYPKTSSGKHLEQLVFCTGSPTFDLP
jgi:hypothetical protein